MAKIKLKDLLSESKKQKVDEAMLNEDASTTLLILSQMALANAAIQMAISRGATTGGRRDTRSMGEKLKDFYEKYTKVKPLMNKLDKDPDVQKFVKDNIGGDHKGYHNLIKSKLSPDEMKFLTKIKFDELPSVKDPEKSAQMKADRKVKLKQQSQDYNDFLAYKKLQNTNGNASANLYNATISTPDGQYELIKSQLGDYPDNLVIESQTTNENDLSNLLDKSMAQGILNVNLRMGSQTSSFPTGTDV